MFDSTTRAGLSFLVTPSFTGEPIRLLLSVCGISPIGCGWVRIETLSYQEQRRLFNEYLSVIDRQAG